jgi:hypothetical protein
MVIQHLGKKSIQTNRDKSDVLRHIIKNVSERLFRLIESRSLVTEPDFSQIGKEFFLFGMERQESDSVMEV